MNQTTHLKQEAVNHEWRIISAKGQVLGDVAVKVAQVLMGKNRANWTPTVDSGSFVVVTDVDALVVTGNKAEKKTYKFHSGWMGGIKEINFETLHAKKPEQVFELAVKRMLPKTVQGSHQLKRLKVYKGSAHPHISQQPKPL